MAAYFLYVIAAPILISVTGIVLLQKSKIHTVALPIPILLFILLAAYFLIQSFFIQHEDINLRHIALIVDCLLLIACCILIHKNLLDTLTLCKAITLFAAIESFICLFQYAGWLNSNNSFFKVTGSWGNPNVTAMFLTMAVPAIWVLFQQKNYHKKIAIAVSALMVTAIILLACRTAFIGIVVALTLLFNFQYSIVKRLKNKYSVFKLLLFSVVTVVVIASCAVYLYQVKQASADGRKLIWKISADMLAQKPFTGYGYGMFEHDYNLAQANYFESNAGTKEETTNASYVYMAYSELMENAVEGGIIAAVLFTAILAILLFNKPSHKKSTDDTGKNVMNVAAYSGIAAFAVMSIFNFTVQAIPVMCLFILYASVKISDVDYTFKTKPFFFPKKPMLVFTSLFIIAGVSVGVSQYSLMDEYALEKEAQTLAVNGQIQDAITIFASQQNKLNHYGYYWLHYTNALYANKQYALAAAQLQEALHYTSNPELYLLQGNCYFKLQRYSEAQAAYNTAKYIQPNHFAPRYALMKLYYYTKDSVNAIKTANEIIAMQPKTASETIDFYKKEANNIIQQYDYKKSR